MGNAELNSLNIFNRIFFIAGSSTSNKCGKTSYHSDKVFDFTVHYPDDLKFHWVDFDTGHSSHFRETYTFRQINICLDCGGRAGGWAINTRGSNPPN